MPKAFKSLLILAVMCAQLAFAQTTTIYGLIDDLTGNPVTTGKVTMTLRPSSDVTISGTARFTTQTVTCPIASTGNVVNLANSNISATSGTTSAGTSVTVTSATGFAAGQPILIPGAGVGGVNYVGSISAIASLTFTITPATSTSVSAGTPVYTPCQVMMNTAIQPPGSGYQLGFWPGNVNTATIFFYALNPLLDITAIVSTPGQLPSQGGIVDTYSNQTIAGTKTFTGIVNFPVPIAGLVDTTSTQTVAGAKTFANANGVVNPDSCAGAGAPSWCNGSDMGAWINAANAYLGPTGGDIFFSSCRTFSTPILLGQATGKIVRLHGVGPAACLNYTPSTGTALSLDWGNGGNQGAVEALSNFWLEGASAANSTVGISIGGNTSYPYTQNVKTVNVTVSGFGTGIIGPTNASGTSFDLTFDQMAVDNNGVGFVFNDNIPTRIYNSEIDTNTNYGIELLGQSMKLVMGGNDIEANGVGLYIDVASGGVTVVDYGSHWEAPGTSPCTSAQFVTVNAPGATVLLDGDDFQDDCPTGTQAQFITWTSGQYLSLRPAVATSEGRTLTNVINSSASSCAIDAAMDKQSLLIGPIVTGGSCALEDKSINGSGGGPSHAIDYTGYEATWNLPASATLFLANQGNPCTNGELALSSGWGNTAAVSAVNGLGQTCEWTITSSGTGQGASPTITDTLTNSLPSATVLCEMRMTGGTGTSTLIDQTTGSATAPVFTFNGTPAASSTYKVLRRCGP